MQKFDEVKKLIRGKYKAHMLFAMLILTAITLQTVIPALKPIIFVNRSKPAAQLIKIARVEGTVPVPSIANIDGNIIAQSRTPAPAPAPANTATGAGSLAGRFTGCNETPENCNFDGLAYQPVCTRTSVSVDFGGGDGSQATQNGGSVTVNKNSKLIIWRVTAPTAILSGSYELEDSQFLITDENAVFKSAGDFIDPVATTTRLLPPTQVEDALGIDAVAQKGPFSVTAQVAVGDEAPPTPSGDRTTIFNELMSKCIDIQPSEVNPDATNKQAQFLVNGLRPPTSQLNGRDYGSSECVYVEPGEVSLPRAEVFETCVNRRNPLDFFVGASFTVGQWAECAADPSQCEDVQIAGIIVDAPFGTNSQCVEGFCADQYYDQMISMNLSPVGVRELQDMTVETGGRESVLQNKYVTTPCQIQIDYRKIADIPCLWDVTPYWSQYELQRMSLDPAQAKDYPTWEEYWSKVEQAAESRGQACGF